MPIISNFPTGDIQDKTYGVCSTAAGTVAKTVNLEGYRLVTGAEIAVKFTVTNTATNPTLNVTNTGAKAIFYRGAAISAGYLAAKRIYKFVYDGTNYELVGDIDTNTTYAAAANTPQAAGTAAVGTSAKYAREDHVHPAQSTISGNAGTATKLATERKVDGVAFNGSADIVHYGTCSTAAATAAKVVALTGFSLVTGAEIAVKFTAANTAANPTLNVNNTGAKSIMKYGTTAADTNMWQAGAVVVFAYDGTNWVMEDGTTATTTYYGVTKLSSATNSTATNLAATPSAVKSAYDLANTANTNLTTHTGNKSNPHGVTKSQVGLGNVDNTSDSDKPISTATQTALNGKQNKLSGAQTDFVSFDASGNAQAKSLDTLKSLLGIPALEKIVGVTNVLNDNSWSIISKVSEANMGANYWAIGDTKRITLNGKVGDYTFSNFAVDVFILGFNHNSAKEGGKRIHFQIGKINGNSVALCDSHYNTSSTSTERFHMNNSDTNVGGWKESHMRQTILGNSGSPTNPLANSLLAALPADLRAVMKSVQKYTDNTAGQTDIAGNVTATADWLFLLAEFEVFGTRYYANSAEQNYQHQYDYYKAGNSRVAYNHSATSTAVLWWLRSPSTDGNRAFRFVNATGNSTDYGGGHAYTSAGVRPGFSV